MVQLHTQANVAEYLNKTFGEYYGFWAVAGGWAIDLFLGQKTREHKDIEVAVWRDEQELLHKYLSQWDCQYYEKGQPKKWLLDMQLELPIHEIHCKYQSDELEVLLNEREDGQWIFRRNGAITYPENMFFQDNSSGLKILSPEIVLLYKAKEPKAFDTDDLHNALGRMNSHQKEWLSDAISKMNQNHPWLAIISQ